MSWLVGYRRNFEAPVYIRAWHFKLDLPIAETTDRRKAMIFPSLEFAVEAMQKTPLSATMMFIEEQSDYEGR